MLGCDSKNITNTRNLEDKACMKRSIKAIKTHLTTTGFSMEYISYRICRNYSRKESDCFCFQTTHACKYLIYPISCNVSFGLRQNCVIYRTENIANISLHKWKKNQTQMSIE